MTSTSGDGSPYDMLEQEELLYTENYPGKLCALCNLSERSTLGQGDIIKLKVTIGEDGEVKLEKSHSETGDADDDMKSPSSVSNLNARRLKGRKFTSGEGYEPFDELENIGFAEEPDIGLLFETSGYFYVHENCAMWSDGVTKKAVKAEDPASEASNKTPEKAKNKKDNSILIGVDKAVKASTNQRCAYCKHFGASVKCKASGKMYHFPCAAASGSFMHKPTMTLVGTESLSKVSTYSDNAMYLYHNGEAWKFGKVQCSQCGKMTNFLPFIFYVKSFLMISE